MIAVFIIVVVLVLAATPFVLYLSASKRKSPVALTILAGIPLVLVLCTATFVYFQGSAYAGWTWDAAWSYVRIIRIPLLVLVVIPAILYLSVCKRKSRVTQDGQKPPLSRGRIAGEILAGTATGFTAAVPVVCVILRANADSFKGCFGGFYALAIILYGFPMVYGPASAIGVYLVGGRGKEAGSFLLTLACGSLGGIIMLAMFPFAYFLSGLLIVGTEKMVLWVLRALAFLIPPCVATLGFNLTRRHEEPVSPQS